MQQLGVHDNFRVPGNYPAMQDPLIDNFRVPGNYPGIQDPMIYAGSSVI
jgi:hypothetical protein